MYLLLDQNGQRHAIIRHAEVHSQCDDPSQCITCISLKDFCCYTDCLFHFARWRQQQQQQKRQHLTVLRTLQATRASFPEYIDQLFKKKVGARPESLRSAMCLHKYERDACSCDYGSECRQNYYATTVVIATDGVRTHTIPDAADYYESTFCKKWGREDRSEDPYGCPNSRTQFIGYIREGPTCTRCFNGKCRRLAIPN